MAFLNKENFRKFDMSQSILLGIALLVATSIIITGVLSTSPILRLTEKNATEEVQGVVKEFYDALTERTLNAVRSSEFISQSDTIKNDLERVLRKNTPDEMSTLLEDVVPFYQASQASFIAFFTPEKRGIVGLDHSVPFGEDFSSSAILQDFRCEDASSGIVSIKGQLHVFGGSCLFKENEAIAIVIFGYKVDEAFVAELSEKNKALFHVASHTGEIASTFSSELAQLAALGAPDSEARVTNTANGRVAFVSNRILDVNHMEVGKVTAAVSLHSFYQSLKEARKKAAVSVALPFLLTILFLLMLGKRLVSLVHKSNKMQQQIATTLHTRDSLRSMKTKQAAAKLVAEEIYREVSAYSNAQTSFLLLPEPMTPQKLYDSPCNVTTEMTQHARDALEGNESPVFGDDVLYIPIAYHGVKLGVLAMTKISQKIGVTDLHFVSMMGGALGGTFQALNNLAETESRLRKEAKMAAESAAIEVIQQSLLPAEVKIPRIEMATHYKAAESAGGDWYGCYFDDTRKVAYFLVGDVTGHGISSAIITGVACGASLASEQSLCRYENSPETHVSVLMEILNNAICAVGRSELAMTMCVFAIEIETGHYHWASAAHTHPFLIESSSGKVHALSNMGRHLGLAKDQVYSVKSGTLCPDDILIFYTDGLIENSGPDGTTFQDSMLKKAVAGLHNVHAIKGRVLKAYENILSGADPTDDVSLLILQWNGPHEASTQAPLDPLNKLEQ